MLVLLLKGLPASGKSTFAKQLVGKDPKTWKRINKDDIRSMLFGDNYVYSMDLEQSVLSARDSMLKSFLQSGFNVVIDDTNLHYKHPKRVAEIASLFGAAYQEKHFDVDLNECIRRDITREKSVGSAVIKDMHQKYIQNGKWKKPVDFFEIQPIVQDKSLPHVYISDVDGTCAMINPANPRSHYDMSRVHEDLPRQEVVETIFDLQQIGCKFIFFSGRTDDGFESTKQWLDDQGIWYPNSELYMRKAGDQRRDFVIKKELFDNHIAGKYYVTGVFDDRDQCVELWRRLGLQTFQVNYGNF